MEEIKEMLRCDILNKEYRERFGYGEIIMEININTDWIKYKWSLFIWVDQTRKKRIGLYSPPLISF